MIEKKELLSWYDRVARWEVLRVILSHAGASLIRTMTFL